MKVANVYHRKDAIWHFTVVGRPPQEDSSFGYLIHQLVKDLTSQEFPGLADIHAVDEAGVHPLLLAIGNERYMPFREKVPEEILTIANRILGSGQTSLAKYLFIAAKEDAPDLSAHHLKEYFTHILQRVDWRRDLHFQTKTTIDTLDYSGDSWNGGSKLVIACRGEVRRHLAQRTPSESISGMKGVKLVMPGVLAIPMCQFSGYSNAKIEIEALLSHWEDKNLEEFPLIVLCDDADFLAASLANFVWATFTRSNPSHDIYGIRSFTEFKHWGCHGSLVIDARVKPHHAPGLIPDQAVQASVSDMLRNLRF